MRTQQPAARAATRQAAGLALMVAARAEASTTTAQATATTTLTNVTLTLNRADAGNAGTPTAGPGGGIKIVTGTVTMNNTIVAGNVTGASGNPNAVADDISGTVDASSSYNLIGTGGSGGLVDVSTDTAHNNQVGVADAKLGALASNGGPTKTHAPADDSPAIDKGKNFAVDGSSNPILKDQRGFTRPVDIGTVTNAANGDASDIGAFEKQATPDPPGVPDLVDASDSGAHNDDNYTNVTTPQFNIASVTIGATVELLRDGNSVASVTASGTSVSLTDNTVPSDGVYSYTARQTVSAVQSAPSGAINPSVTIDTAAPGKPSTPVLKPSDDSGAADGVTNVTTPTFTGTAEPNSAVQLFANGNLVGAGPADNGGAWSIASSVLADGSYNISAKATDLAGNVSIKSDDLPVTIDATAPTVSMSSTALNPTNVSPIPVTVTFSESVTGFSSSDITASNATVGNFAGSGASYSFELTPLSQGPVSADIAANVATDTAGNGNTAAVQFNRTYNTDAPTVSITAVSPDPRHTSVSSIQIVFSKAVTGFDLSHLSLTLDGGSNLLTGSQTLNSADSGKTWTLGNLSGLTGADGVYTLTLTPSGITDTAGNPLTAGATETWKMDTVPPTVSVAKDAGQADPTHGPTASTVINFTITFNEAVTGFSSTGVNKTGAAGVTATGVTVSQTDADGKIYNVGVEGMTKAGPVTIDILAGAATDDAGNGNTASPGSATVNFTPDNFSTLEVNTTADHADDGCDALGTGAGHQDCTLREAINAANNDFGAETITFNIPTSDPGYDAGTGRYTIKLSFASAEDSNSALYVNGDVTITGPGANLLTVQRDNAAPRFRVFRINSGTVNISGLTVAGSSTPAR
ncbi:MAG: hypothetical protein DMF67_15400 [Acidobacteria bacterium]|nr:MAG: hypothetical protein DMF67_15400 [Acidobacteriota bacterium]